MKVLVIGSGGREHALVWKLRQSPRVDQIFCAPGNGGTEAIAENVAVAASDIPGLLQVAKKNQIDLTVVGPDDPLAGGVVDEFATAGLRIFGPTRQAASLESSKVFAKNLMLEQGIPTAPAQTFEDVEAALSYCREARYPQVLKADGLALGKGVIIAPDRATAEQTVLSSMEGDQFGEAGRRLVIEEFLEGWECSLHLLVGRGEFQMLATAQDHKRAYDGNTGPNTGGMGAFSPSAGWTDDLQANFENRVLRPLLSGLTTRSIHYRGLLFPGLIVTRDGIKVLEFNARFGDPETQVILPRLRSDLLELLEATIDGQLDHMELKWDPSTAVTVVLASGGYPGKYETGKLIHGLSEAAKLPDIEVFHAGTKRQGGDLVTAGGRVLAVTALGQDLVTARTRCYEAVSLISFDGMHYRHDIGAAG